MSNSVKSIDFIMPPPHYHMVGDGFRVHNFFPSQPQIGLAGMSPFFLLDYGSKWLVPPSPHQRGVGVHPHRGFETVTISYRGSVAHNDSAGNSGVINEGDVQWMTAGAGVLHKEYHEKSFSLKGGVFQMVQLWVNLPSKYKMTPAKYQAITNNQMTRIVLEDGKSYLELIAGEYDGKKGPASTFSPVNLFNAKLEKGAILNLALNREHNTGILIIDGVVKINDKETAPEDHFVLFKHDGENIKVTADIDSKILILSGEPIKEPIASHGPFVMNNEAEIKQAYLDFSNGKFGYLED